MGGGRGGGVGGSKIIFFNMYLRQMPETYNV